MRSPEVQPTSLSVSQHYGKRIVFTGKLMSMTQDAAELASIEPIRLLPYFIQAYSEE
jgi:hypothetical protein